MKFKASLLLLFPFLLLFSASLTAQEPLPKQMTEEEKKIYQQYLDEILVGKSAGPPASIPRTPAEFEEIQGVIITWAGYAAQLREIVRHAREVTTVYIICSGTNIANIQSYLVSGNVPLDHIVFIDAPFNSVWVRDYGPQSIYLAESDQLAFVDWVYNRPRPNDNLIPGVMASHFSVPLFQMTDSPYRLIATGGNFMTDGLGTGFSSELIIEENPGLTEIQIDQIVHNYMGISRYIKMPRLPYDVIGHIDMHMKLLDEETLLVGQFPEGISDGPYIEANLKYVVENFPSVYNRPYRVVRIPMVPGQSGNYPPNSAYRTFTNSIILNNLVLVPVYGHYLDNVGLQVYREAMPGYNIVGINMEAVIGANGAIHCISREIAAEDPILFAHAQPQNPPSWQQMHEIKATIKSHSGISNAWLYWRSNPSMPFVAEKMILQNDTFRAWIPGQDCTAEIAYYFSATNGNGKTGTKPLVAPEGFYRFLFGENEVDFFADRKKVGTGEPVTFMTCSESNHTLVWDFGPGALPQYAVGAGPHEVVYQSSGLKTVIMTIDGTTDITKENYIKVSDPTEISLVIGIEGEGYTHPAPGSYYFESNTSIEITATPKEGWKFMHWLIQPADRLLETETIRLNITENTTATAVFGQQTGIARSQPPGIRFKVYPNPSEGQMLLTMPANKTPVEVIITNMLGQVVKRKIIQPAGSDIMVRIDLMGQPPGIYLIRLTDGNETATDKIIIR